MLVLGSCFVQFGNPNQDSVPPTFWTHLPSLVRPLQKQACGQPIQKDSALVTLKPSQGDGED